MKVNIDHDHGLIVWAKMTSKAESWAGMIISVKLMDFLFEEKPGNTWVWWIYNNTFSLVKNDLIYNFFLDFKSHSKNASGQRKKGILEAIQMISVRYEFDIPEDVIFSDHALILWASENIEALTKNKMGKSKRNEPYIIPNDIVQKMVNINLKNVQSAIDFNIEKTLRAENGRKKKDLYFYSKKNSQYCIACRVENGSLQNRHPLFRGFICDSCNINAKQFLMPIAKDLSNVRCCICFSLESNDLILCDFCVRVFCKNCLSVFCGSQSFTKIKRVHNWACFACKRKSSSPLPCGLVSLSIEKQIQNIFNFYPPDNLSSDLIKKKLMKNRKIQVLAIQDDQNIVTKIFKELQFPCRLAGSNYSKDVIFKPKKRNIKLLIQYYPNSEDYDEDKFNSNGSMEEFFNFLYLKNELENIQDPNNKSVFWAFESSAAITNHESNVISRFLRKKPILISMKTKNVRQRARFIWSNITILNKNIKQLRNQDIFHHNICETNTNDNTDESTPWCYSSVYSIINSLIQNNILHA